jgi:hypothetical protein
MNAAYRFKMMTLMALITIAMSWGGGAVNFAQPAGKAAFTQTSDGRSYRATQWFAIRATQTARLKVTHLQDVNRDDPFFRIELTFVDRKGKVISQKVHTLDRESAGLLDLKGSELLPRAGNNAQLRAIVRFVGTPDTRIADRYLATLEVFDNQSGEISFSLPLTQKVQKVQAVRPKSL